MLAPKGDLAAAELAFFSPAFLLGTYIVIKHRSMAWFYIVTLSILRIVGSSATLYMDVNDKFTASLIETASITSAVGTAPLLLALMGFLERINHGMGRKGLPKKAFHLLHLLSLAALAIAIVGGTKIQYSDHDTYETGRDLLKAASLIFLAIFISLAAITLRCGLNKTHILSNEFNLMRACIIASVFILVRIVYTVCTSWANQGSIFYFGNVNVYVQAFMQFLMEALAVIIFVIAGIMTPMAAKHEPLDGRVDVESGPKEVEMISGPTRPIAGNAPRQQPQSRPARSIGDYRPSRLIRDAIRSR
jgi:hypothetical protein